MDDQAQLDNTGKVSLDHIYTAPDPRAYYRALHRLEYCIPQLALPHFTRLIDSYRQTRGISTPTIVDIGSSYGVNAALMRHGITIGDLYNHYGCRDADALCREALVKRDQTRLPGKKRENSSRWIGFDRSAQALSYALDAGLLDDAINGNFERYDPTDEQKAQLEGADIIISTGCVGYVTEKTITRVVDACGGKRPWMAHFVLRMFSFEPVSEALAARGYETTKMAGAYRQRRFAMPQEQTRVLDALAKAGIDATGLEDEGWFYAELYISKPANEIPNHADIRE